VVANLMIAAAHITSPDTYRFPLADPIFDWQRGELRTLPTDFFGWSPIARVGAYLMLGLPNDNRRHTDTKARLVG
jgi:hypothetical protein